MRLMPLLLLLLSGAAATGQSADDRWHAAIGVTEATLSFRQNAAGALAIPIRYDAVTGHNSSLSLGTNLKIGSEDEYGASFPAILILMVIGGLTGGNADFTDLGTNINTQSADSYSINLFADFPLMLQYNWGLGTANEAGHRFGWFAGAGASYTITGLSLNNAGHGTSENFFGWIGNLGIRFARNKELGFSTTLPMQNTIGGISHPLFFALTFAVIPRDL